MCMPALEASCAESKQESVDMVKEKTRNNRLYYQRVPFVAVIIENIQCSRKLYTAGVMMLLKDRTEGTIGFDLYEEYKNELKVGSVIVLQQFLVLITSRGYNVDITRMPESLVAIYSNDINCIENISKVNVTTIQEFSVDDCIKKINIIKMSEQTLKKLKYILSFGKYNFNKKPSVQKSQIQHVNNNKFSTPTSSRSSSDIAVRCNDRNIQNVSTSRNVAFPAKITAPNNVNSNRETKFNFKAPKSNNIKMAD
ncbi:hypothetical protein ILUMI_24276 [Ignelater luminosus]|uniref:Homologous recombination OB-fold protein OB-fold domain-containing protein n=1 Tax=Ignelater luminosus TaxID=2038154 RepID=A0A8K0FWM6_IGNLU|nr:hypothetical protein ILUMI_24276 [Ignelater luminosus]